ncbi:MAG: putative SAM-dependent methyltransferase [Acidimicrobiia bacterium]|nr:putative SAM-dependent methyltransferase [Acidimicrobiia bacterium]
MSAPDGPLVIHVDGHGPRPLGSARWSEPATVAERELLSRLPGPVLDMGCGPGRLVVALQQLGQVALGIDSSCAAAALARAQGAAVLCRSLFEALPGEGRWGSVLLFDGNIGIAGDPVALLRRAAQLIAVNGRVVVEVDPPGSPTVNSTACLRRGPHQSLEFPWAMVAADDLEHLLVPAGLWLERWVTFEDRWLAVCAPVEATVQQGSPL